MNHEKEREEQHNEADIGPMIDELIQNDKLKGLDLLQRIVSMLKMTDGSDKRNHILDGVEFSISCQGKRNMEAHFGVMRADGEYVVYPVHGLQDGFRMLDMIKEE